MRVPRAAGSNVAWYCHVPDGYDYLGIKKWKGVYVGGDAETAYKNWGLLDEEWKRRAEKDPELKEWKMWRPVSK